MEVYTARVVTESMDTYVWVYAYKPTREQVIRRLFEFEGAETLEYYDETTAVIIDFTYLVEEE